MNDTKPDIIYDNNDYKISHNLYILHRFLISLNFCLNKIPKNIINGTLRRNLPSQTPP